MSTCYIWGPMAPVREIEMGGGEGQTDRRNRDGVWGGGGVRQPERGSG